MKALAGLAAVVVIVIGTAVVARTPGATTPRIQGVEVMESQLDEAPPFVDPDDWR